MRWTATCDSGPNGAFLDNPSTVDTRTRCKKVEFDCTREVVRCPSFDTGFCWVCLCVLWLLSLFDV